MLDASDGSQPTSSVEVRDTRRRTVSRRRPQCTALIATRDFAAGGGSRRTRQAPCRRLRVSTQIELGSARWSGGNRDSWLFFFFFFSLGLPVRVATKDGRSKRSPHCLTLESDHPPFETS